MDSINNNNNPLKGLEKKCVDSHLWHACAGGMVQIPPINSKVFYFPQGYAEHAHDGNVEFGNSHRIPAQILSRIVAIKYLADPESDEVYAMLSLVPLSCVDGSLGDDDGELENNGIGGLQKPVSFAKTLTQSDANNGGGFSVPRYCAETIFPRLDYRAEPPVQTILAKDVHGETWKFRHIYRGTPRRHLLTTGWSNFVNRKKLVAGDSIVFLRAENGDLCIGIRRAKRGIGGGGPESSCGWNPAAGNCTPFGGYSFFLGENENKFPQTNSNWCLRERGKVTAESVIEATTLAASGRPFEVVYYPRASSPEFCVKASALRAAMQVQWCPGMRFKMAFETEDSSRVSWFMGAISSVQVADPIHWPNSPWRFLLVTWDEPDLLQNVKRVSPWLVELVSNIPALHLSPFLPPRKKLRVPQHPDFSLLSQLPVQSFSSNPLRPSTTMCYTPSGVQGARHAHVGLSSLDVCSNESQSNSILINGFRGNPNSDENTSCLLTMGNPSTTPNLSKNRDVKAPQFVLFGQPILTEEQISQSCSNDTSGNSGSDVSIEKAANTSDGSGSASAYRRTENSRNEGLPYHYKDHHHNTKLGNDTGYGKVFMESKDVGRILDLSVLGSYEEQHRMLAGIWHKKVKDAEQYALMGQGGKYH